MKQQHLTYAAVAMAVLAVAYAFRRPAQPAANQKASAVSDFAKAWDAQFGDISLSSNMAEYKTQLARMPGFYLSAG